MSDFDSDVGQTLNHKHGKHNPHPGHGTDPNIMNEHGHTHYPKYVSGVTVYNEAEEKAVLGDSIEVKSEKSGYEKKGKRDE